MNAGRRGRKTRIFTIVSSLGEIHLVDNDHVPALLEKADYPHV